MICDGENPIRFNREPFGYIVGYPTGDIVLTDHAAEDKLLRGAPLDELRPHLLETLDVYPGFHLQTPPLVWIELTRRCNLSCNHCYIRGGDARANEMPTTEFYRLLDEMAEMGVWAVAFTGGEPTLHPDFVSLVQYAHRKQLIVGIATNGMFLTEDLLSQLPRDRLIISVSIDSLHIPSVNGSSEFAFVTKAILRAQEMGFLTNIMSNTHSGNISELHEMMSWAEANGVSIRSVPCSPLGRGKEHRYLQNTAKDVEVAASFWLRECQWEHEYHKKAGLCVGTIFNYGLSFAYMTRRCSSGRYLCYVCADGVVYPCTMCAGEEILSPGSVRNQSFSGLWRAAWEIRQYSWDNFRSTCESCPLNDPIYYCASRCPALSHARNEALFGCGASEFEKLSMVYRTGLLERTAVGQASNTPQAGTQPNGTQQLDEAFGF